VIEERCLALSDGCSSSLECTKTKSEDG
jgi:hypothetical protein